VADDDPAGEGGEHEDVKRDEAADRYREFHIDLPRFRSSRFGRWFGCFGLRRRLGAVAWPPCRFILPAWVRTVLARISSSQSILTMLSFIIRASRLYWFFA
jgi:hypothetical protein